MNASALKEKFKQGKLFVDGKWQDAVSPKAIPVINPATGEQLTTIPDANPEDVDRFRRHATTVNFHIRRPGQRDENIGSP